MNVVTTWSPSHNSSTSLSVCRSVTWFTAPPAGCSVWLIQTCYAHRDDRRGGGGGSNPWGCSSPPPPNDCYITWGPDRPPLHRNHESPPLITPSLPTTRLRYQYFPRDCHLPCTPPPSPASHTLIVPDSLFGHGINCFPRELWPKPTWMEVEREYFGWSPSINRRVRWEPGWWSREQLLGVSPRTPG